MDLSDWRVSFYPNSLLTLLWKIFWSKQAVQGKVLCATRGHCVCMSNGVIYSYAANSQNIFIIPWSWSYLTDDFSRGFFSGYVMIWSPNSKDHSSGNLLFSPADVPVLSVSWSDTSGNDFSCLPKIYLCICVGVELQTLGCDDSTFSNLLFGVHKDLEYFRDIQTWENMSGCEHSSRWMTEICQKESEMMNMLWESEGHPTSDSQAKWMLISGV